MYIKTCISTVQNLIYRKGIFNTELYPELVKNLSGLTHLTNLKTWPLKLYFSWLPYSDTKRQINFSFDVF